MLYSIQYSLTYARNSVATFIHDQPFLFIIIGILIIRSIVAQIIKSRLKNKYLLPYENQGNIENKEFHLKYYRKVHMLNIFGVALVAVLLITYLITKNQVVGTVLAVGIGAMLLTFQTFTVSLLMYFILMNDYRVGDYIRIHGMDIQGEILHIKPLYIGIAGKNKFGENTGEFFLIPNNQVRLNVITKVNLSRETYTRSSLIIPYDAKLFPDSFDETVQKIQTFLNNLLPLRAASQVGHFKTYIGVRYKMGYDYKDDKSLIRIGYLTSRTEEMETKRQILSFIENLKANQLSLSEGPSKSSETPQIALKKKPRNDQPLQML